MPSAALVEALAEMDGRPWAEFGRNEKPITQNKLARLLKPLKIVPDSIRIDEKRTPKGYYLNQFEEAFSRYLDPEEASEPQHRNNADEMGTSELFQSATADADVAVRKCEKPNNDGPCCGVAVQKGVSGEEREALRAFAAVPAATKSTSATGRRRGCTANARRCIGASSMRATLQMDEIEKPADDTEAG